MDRFFLRSVGEHNLCETAGCGSADSTCSIRSVSGLTGISCQSSPASGAHSGWPGPGNPVNGRGQPVIRI